MDRKLWLIRLMALALVLPVAACADRDENEIDMEAETAPLATPDATTQPMTIQLQPIGSSGISGEATATHGTDDVTIRVSMQGLTEDDEYEARLEYGSCAMAGYDKMTGDFGDEMGDEEEFAELELEADGMSATATTTVDADELGPDQDAYLLVVTDDGERAVACADLRGHGGTGMGGPGGAGMSSTRDSAGYE